MKQKFITEEQFLKMYNYTVECDINNADSDNVLVRVFKKNDVRGEVLPAWSMLGNHEVVEQELKFRFNIVQYINGNKKIRIKK